MGRSHCRRLQLLKTPGGAAGHEPYLKLKHLQTLVCELKQSQCGLHHIQGVHHVGGHVGCPQVTG